MKSVVAKYIAKNAVKNRNERMKGTQWWLDVKSKI